MRNAGDRPERFGPAFPHGPLGKSDWHSGTVCTGVQSRGSLQRLADSHTYHEVTCFLDVYTSLLSSQIFHLFYFIFLFAGHQWSNTAPFDLPTPQAASVYTIWRAN